MSKRKSITEQLLEKENRMLRDQLDKIRNNPPSIPFSACDNSCCIARPEGMHTNGGCRCSEDKLRAAIWFWRQYAQHLTASLSLLRDGDPIKAWGLRLHEDDGSSAAHAVGGGGARVGGGFG